ncbi:MAG: hypothetical protein AAGE52_09955 [Myxococcota bacterium]
MSDEKPKNAVETKVAEILQEASEMGYGAERISKVEEAVREADAAGEELAAFDARLGLVEAAVFGGYPEKGFVAFGWLAAKTKQNPERFKESSALLGMFLGGVDVLWAYKWMSLQVPWYPQVSLRQIRETLEDMEERYQKHGFSLRPVHMAWTRVAIDTSDDPEEAYAHYRKWQWAPRDLYADCEACEVSFQAHFHAHRGEHERALQVAGPLLNGALGCAEVPHETYARLLESAMELGKQDEAARFHDVGYPMVRDNRDFVWAVSRHIVYLTAIGNHERALELARRHLPWALGNRIADRKMWFYAACRDLFAVLDAQVSIRMDGVPETDDPVVLRDFFAAEVQAIAERFDARNNNDVISRQVL